MPHTVTQRLIAVLCLLATGLGQSVFGSLGVRCEDLAGQRRFEWACVKTIEGNCLAGSDADGTDARSSFDSIQQGQDGPERTPLPCKDRPIHEPSNLVKLLPKSNLHEAGQLVAVLATFVQQASFIDLPRVCLTTRPWAACRPPDTLARLRSVILTV